MWPRRICRRGGRHGRLACRDDAGRRGPARRPCLRRHGHRILEDRDHRRRRRHHRRLPPDAAALRSGRGRVPAATGATIKFGIRHRDWRRVGHSYDGPIDDPHRVAGFDVNALDVYQVAQGESVGQTHLFQHLLNANRSPFAMVDGRRVPVGPFHHAYHFDQALAGKWLRSKAKAIATIDDQVPIRRTPPGDGEHHRPARWKAAPDRGRPLHRLHRLPPRADRPDGRPSGSATATPCPSTAPSPSGWTSPTAKKSSPAPSPGRKASGWMWKIPTQGRYGCGYVFSDAHATPDQAKAEIEAALGHPIEVRNDIRIDAGRLDRQWIPQLRRPRPLLQLPRTAWRRPRSTAPSSS